MRRVLLAALLLFPACTTTTNPGGNSRHTCNATGTDRFVGLPGSSETGTAILQATHSAELRWAPPGYMLTMDYREDRVTVRLGPHRRVTAINCR